jgi:broad specificity phosphatase PhoE
LYGVLQDDDWGESAKSLLSQCRNLKENIPAIMIIRHSERPKIKTLEDISELTLTQRGKEAAYDFGASLPSNRTYRIFHSRIVRTEETAKEIERGIKSRGVKTGLLGTLSFLSLSHSKREKALEYILHDWDNFTEYWFSGRYPTWEIESSLVLAQRTASGIVNNVQEGDANVMDIYVSHDYNIIAYMFHWFGEFHPLRWIKFLDGFILQFSQECITMFRKDGVKEINYPHWWSFKHVPFAKL